jgi:exodeoxyribonuclease V gamma subunit
VRCHSAPVASFAVLEVRIADRVEPLLDVLVELLRVPAEDPFEPGWVAVPSIGMRRWLAQQLSRRLGASGGVTDGVSANIALPFPAELRRRVLAAVPAGDEARALPEDPWDVERLPWPVLEVLTDPATARQDVLAPLTVVARGGTLTGRALSLADLLDRYSLHRPDMVRAWAEGQDVDAAGEPLARSQRWQPALFRSVRERLACASPAERFAGLVQAVRVGDLNVDLPGRLVLFGLSTLPPDVAPLLDALAHQRDVHALLTSPSVPLARRVATGMADRRPAAPLLRRDHDESDAVRHPVLRSWGTASRETVALLGAAGMVPAAVGDPVPEPAPGAQASLFDDVVAAPDGPTTLLGRLQADIRADRTPDGSHVLDPDDRSVQVHACTGVTRQVEVLRDALLHLLAADPDLTEGDIAVLCPRMDVFSPVIQAVLGPSADRNDDDGGGDDGPPRLRYRITDRTVRSDVPLLGVVGALLDLVPGRFTASGVADLIGLGPVRDRFGLSIEDLGQLDTWIEEARVRWGLDGSHRSAWGLPAAFTANSWEAGADQWLMGTSVRADALTLTIGDIAPLGVGDSSTVVAARTAEAVRTLASVRADLLDDRPLAAWCVALRVAVDRMASLAPTESWQRRRLDRILDDLVAASTGPTGGPSDAPLNLGDMRRLLADRLVGDPARAAFGTGAVTFCSLSPLRSVPHRVVCVLGLDQDALPRGLVSGDDLLAAAPVLGDRDARSEARQLLLEAVLSARDALVVTTGAVDVRTNAPIPPAVVVDELWDCLADTCGLGPEAVRAALELRHPRQAFAASNFVSGSRRGAPVGPWSFDPMALDGARARADRPDPAGFQPLFPRPLDRVGSTDDVVGLEALLRFLRKPVETFFTDRLGLRLPRVDEAGIDDLPIVLDPLERYQVGDRLLECLIEGIDPGRVVEVLRCRGALPPGVLGDEVADDLQTEIDLFGDAAQELGVPLAADEVRPVDVALHDGRWLRGAATCSGALPGPLTVRFSRSKPHHLLLLAAELFALTAADPGTDWRAVSLHRGTSGKKAPVCHDLRVTGDSPAERSRNAGTALDGLVSLWDRGRTLPLALFDHTSHELAAAGPGARGAALGPARTAWGDGSDKESADPYHRLAFGVPTVSELIRTPIDGAGAMDLAVELWTTVLDAVVGPDGTDA